MVIPRLKAELQTAILGRHIHYEAKVDSTNALARKLALQGCPDGTLILADAQAAGRGRRGNVWFSPEGGLYFSLVLRPQHPFEGLALLTLATGVAVAQALRHIAGVETSVKWPNDVMVGDGKLCGILTEAFTEGEQQIVILGIGINTNTPLQMLPLEIRRTAISLKDICGGQVDNVVILMNVLMELERYYPKLFTDSTLRKNILDDHRRLSSILHRKVTVDSFGEQLTGFAVDFDDDGGLILELQDGSKRIVIDGVVRLL